MAQGFPGRLRPWIFLTFGITRVVGRQPYAFTPGEIPGTHFQGLSQPQGTCFHRLEPRKKSQVTPPGIDSRTVRLVSECLNHYATSVPRTLGTLIYLLTAVGLTHGGSSTVHIYTQRIQRPTQLPTLVGGLSGIRNHSGQTKINNELNA